MTALDATGIHAIEQFADRLQASGRTLLLCGARDQPAESSPSPAFSIRWDAKTSSPPSQAASPARAQLNASFTAVALDLPPTTCRP